MARYCTYRRILSGDSRAESTTGRDVTASDSGHAVAPDRWFEAANSRGNRARGGAQITRICEFAGGFTTVCDQLPSGRHWGRKKFCEALCPRGSATGRLGSL
jgi:hypothetical protein